MKLKYLIWAYICACFYYLLCASFVVYPCYYRYIKLKENDLTIARITIPRAFIIAIMNFIHKLGSLVVFHVIILVIISLIILILTRYSSKKVTMVFIAFFIFLTSLFALFCFDYFIALLWGARVWYYWFCFFIKLFWHQSFWLLKIMILS